MKGKKVMVDRDLSWIQFNQRVLEEAECKENPLMERFNFISIFQSNYDEFFRVRVGGLCDRILLGDQAAEEERLPEKERKDKKELKKILSQTQELLERLDTVFEDTLADAAPYFTRVREEDVEEPEKAFLKMVFQKEVAPYIAPFIIDKKHPFPFFDNEQRVVGATLTKKNGDICFGLIPVRESLPKAVFLPGSGVRFILIEDLISMFAYKVFHKFVIIEKIIFALIRNAEIEENEELYDFGSDMREKMSRLVELRDNMAPVELKYNGENCDIILKHLKKVHCLRRRQMLHQTTPINRQFISLLRRQFPKEKYPELYDKPLSPQFPPCVNPEKPVLDQIRRKDILLSYPYDDIKVLIDLLEQAAYDPRVDEIRISLYRAAADSKVVQALIDAARQQKKVTCLVELRARFDEENNIDWSKRLENAGCRIIYGLPGYKVHCKLIWIGMNDGKGDIAHVGTGNFNEVTARLYTDIALLTAKEEIAADVREVFDSLEEGRFVESSRRMLVAPLCLKSGILELIQQEIDKQLQGEPAGIMLKMNALTDKDIIEKLIEASQAGVKIKMLIRGICCLIPGIPGKTENIEVHSIVGRLLEHSRIYVFGAGDDRKYYISSADFMVRNTTARVEAAVPVTDRAAKQKLATILRLSLQDNVKTRVMQEDGKYYKLQPKPGQKAHCMQEELYAQAYEKRQRADEKKIK